MLHGSQQSAFDLQFCVPSECARRVESGVADLGIVPVVEMHRQDLATIPGTGIACHGPVRSILLISKVEPSSIRRVATDSGSRTSVALTRIVLRERYGCDPSVFSMEPNLDSMLVNADAALLIGDSALRISPAEIPFAVLDLGEEWRSMTGLPMVFALWAGQPRRVRTLLDQGAAREFQESLDYGLSNMDALIKAESAGRGYSPDLVNAYLTRHIVYSIGVEEERGLETFLRLAVRLDSLVTSHQNA